MTYPQFWISYDTKIPLVIASKPLDCGIRMKHIDLNRRKKQINQFSYGMNSHLLFLLLDFLQIIIIICTFDDINLFLIFTLLFCELWKIGPQTIIPLKITSL